MPNPKASIKREKKIVKWLDQYANKVDAVIFLGDVFDFWFEYKNAIPKGYMRFFGKLADLADNGVKIYFFKGNHDMWMFKYFKNELNAEVISNELEITFGGKKFFLHHGDGLGKGDIGYKALKKVFRSAICQWMFARLHPNFGIGLANFLSKKSRLAQGNIVPHQGPEKEILENYIEELDKKKKYDFYLCGHRHLPLEKELDSGAKYINLGDWFVHNSYAYFDGSKLTLKYFEDDLLA
jgi:UDP-2,3-diacylglucosamine hydrolase